MSSRDRESAGRGSEGREAGRRTLFNTPEERQLQEDIVEAMTRSVAREMVLTGEIDATTVSEDELKALAWERLKDIVTTTQVEFETVVDHSESILSDARGHVSQHKLEYAFVFYGLYIEHLLNRAIRDRGCQLQLSEGEVVDIMKRSIHEKTGVTWLLIFGQRMPQQLIDDIKATTSARNSFAHYKWKPSGDDSLPMDEILRREDVAVARAERAVSELLPYIDNLTFPPESDAHSWLTGSSRGRGEQDLSGGHP